MDGKARALIAEAVSLFRVGGDQHWLGATLNNLARIEISGECVTKVRSYRESIAQVMHNDTYASRSGDTTTDR